MDVYEKMAIPAMIKYAGVSTPSISQELAERVVAPARMNKSAGFNGYDREPEKGSIYEIALNILGWENDEAPKQSISQEEVEKDVQLEMLLSFIPFDEMGYQKFFLLAKEYLAELAARKYSAPVQEKKYKEIPKDDTTLFDKLNEEQLQKEAEEVYPYRNIDNPDNKVYNDKIFGAREGYKRGRKSSPAGVGEQWNYEDLKKLDFNSLAAENLTLKQRISELEGEQKWISVASGNMPQQGDWFYDKELRTNIKLNYKEVLVWDGEYVMFAYYWYDKKHFTDVKYDDLVFEDVTHYQPLPSPPSLSPKDSKTDV